MRCVASWAKRWHTVYARHAMTTKAETKRTHITLPCELVKEIDALVGPRGRSAFLVEVARAELKRRWLLNYLEKGEPIWKDEDHPELAAMGTDAWVRALRDRKSERSRSMEAAFGDEELQVK